MSELDYIIPPEIKDDEFYTTILQISSHEQARYVLEIGSSAGGGSTQAFVEGMLQNKATDKNLFCLEVSKPRFDALAQRYSNVPFVKCFHASSVPLESFPTPEEVTQFYEQLPTNLNQYPLTEVLRWLAQDIAYIKENPTETTDGIAHVKKLHSITNFDIVLIDGSEFTGEAEMTHVYGSRIILLDDILGYKNLKNYARLSHDPTYEKICENLNLRNGYAGFRRK